MSVDTPHISWPPCTSLLRHLAYASPLDVLPDYPEHLERIIVSQGQCPSAFPTRGGRPIESYTESYTESDCNSTRIPFAFLLYRGGMHGPQNGFRLVVAESGVESGFIVDSLISLGRVMRDTADFVAFTAGKAGAPCGFGTSDTETQQFGQGPCTRPCTTGRVGVMRDIEHGKPSGALVRKLWDVFTALSQPARRGELSKRQKRKLFDGRIRSVELDAQALTGSIAMDVFPPENCTGRESLLCLTGRDEAVIGMTLIKCGLKPVVAAEAVMAALVGVGGTESDESDEKTDEGGNKRFVVLEPQGTWVYDGTADWPDFRPSA